MGITGNISTMSLAEVFQWLHTSQKTGTLFIKGPDQTKKEVYFQDGVITSASSSDPSELIGQFLLNTKHITEQQLTEALETQKRDHVLLGRLLLQRNILSKQELMRILRSISEEIIYDLFLWKEGAFEFVDDKLPTREMPSLQLDITHLVLEGAQREDEWIRIKQVFPDEHVLVRPNIDRVIDKLPLKTDVAKLLSLVNGARSLYEIARLFKANKFTLLRLMLDLHEEGMVEIGGYEDQCLQKGKDDANKNPLRELIVNVESMMKKGRLNDAERGVIKLEQAAPNNPDVKKLKELIKEKRLETTAKEVINPDAVPTLTMADEKLTKMELSAEQGFLISRINGIWDVKSIVKISPFGETVCLKILKKFLDDGVITFK